MSSLLKTSMAKPSTSKIGAALKAVLAANPKATDTSGESKWDLAVYLRTWKFCQKGNPELSGDPWTIKAGYCELLILKTMQNYRALKDPAFYQLAEMVWAYTKATLPKDYLDGVKDYLRNS